MTGSETAAHWNAAANWLHQRLSEATGQIAQLQGEKAVLELRLSAANAAKEVADVTPEPPG